MHVRNHKYTRTTTSSSYLYDLSTHSDFATHVVMVRSSCEINCEYYNKKVTLNILNVVYEFNVHKWCGFQISRFTDTPKGQR
jgi:hypothetical protein